MGLMNKLMEIDGLPTAFKHEILDAYTRHLLTVAVEQANEACWSKARIDIAVQAAHRDCVKTDKIADLRGYAQEDPFG